MFRNDSMLIVHRLVAPIKSLNNVFAAKSMPAIASVRVGTFIPDSSAPRRKDDGLDVGAVMPARYPQKTRMNHLFSYCALCCNVPTPPSRQPSQFARHLVDHRRPVAALRLPE